MATGQPAFVGKTPALLFDAILNRQPRPIAECQPAVPPELTHIVSKALEKDRELRYRSAADLRTDLKRLRRDAAPRRVHESGLSMPDPEASPASSAATRSPSAASVPPTGPAAIGSGGVGFVVSTRALALTALTLILIAAVTYGALRMRSGRGDDVPLDQLQVTQLTSTGNAFRPAISPDGKYIVYLQGEGIGAGVWLRQTAATNSVQILAPIAGQPVSAATVGPDSTFVDVVRDLKLWRVPFLGGTAKQIADSVAMPVGWSPDGTRMAFMRPAAGRGIDLVVANHDGGDPRVVATRVAPAGFVVTVPGATAVAPAWSPDGQSVAALQRLGDDVREMGVAVFRVADGVVTVVPITGDIPLGLGWLNGSTLLLVQPGRDFSTGPDGQIVY